MILCDLKIIWLVDLIPAYRSVWSLKLGGIFGSLDTYKEIERKHSSSSPSYATSVCYCLKLRGQCSWEHSSTLPPLTLVLTRVKPDEECSKISVVSFHVELCRMTAPPTVKPRVCASASFALYPPTPNKIHDSLTISLPCFHRPLS